MKFKDYHRVLIAYTGASIVDLLLIIFLSHHMSTSNYGIYSQIIFLVTLLIALISFGQNKSLFYYFSSDTVTINSSVSTIINGNFLLSIALLPLAILLITYIGYRSVPLEYLVMYSISIPAQLSIVTLNTYLHSIRQQKKLAFYLGGFSILKLLLLIPVFLTSVSLKWIFILFTSLHYFNFIALQFTTNIYKPVFNITFYKRFIQTGTKLGLATLIAVLLTNLDKLFLIRFLTPEDFAIYKNGTLNIPVISSLYGMISAYSFPYLTHAIQRQSSSRVIKIKSKGIDIVSIFILPLLTFLFVYAQDLITLLFGVTYSRSIIIFKLFLLTYLFRLTSFEDVLLSANKPNLLFKPYITTIVLAIPLFYFLSIKFGNIGILIASITTLLITSILQLQQTSKLLKINAYKMFNFVFIISSIIILTITAYLFRILQFNLYHSEHSLLYISVGLFFQVIVTITYILFSSNNPKSSIYKTINKTFRNR